MTRGLRTLLRELHLTSRRLVEAARVADADQVQELLALREDGIARLGLMLADRPATGQAPGDLTEGDLGVARELLALQREGEALLREAVRQALVASRKLEQARQGGRAYFTCLRGGNPQPAVVDRRS